MHHRSVTQANPHYKQLRVRNNQSVQKSREKSRRLQDETLASILQLEKENEQLIDRIQLVKQEYRQLHQIFKEHTGIDIDQTSTAELKSKKQSTPTEETVSPNNGIDVSNLDGSVVLINGVQYKIVSMNCT